MSLSPGDKLGPYEILALIGAGGMGEVYRARDPRLGRDVAIKVSQERFSERFAREARSIAALNHPNICTLYDVGPNYLVMEYVEGEAPHGPMGLEEALRIARQIGAALEEAHGKGIVHRDLKPANIKIKPDGAVKVLDFGLAKQTAPPDGESDPANSPTLTMGMTQAGAILGTAHYMAPEQARGKAVDKRADIWAFGVVLHEMLTGHRLFRGEDVSEILASVLKEEPKWDGVPTKIQRLLKSCLEKDPKNRLRDIGDAWKLLDETSQPAPLPSRLGMAGWIAAAVLVVVAGVALWAPWRATEPAEQPLVRLDVDLGQDISLANNPRDVILSPDGTRLVYLASVSGGPPRLYTRPLDQPKATELRTGGASQLFFSPDGQWVGFHAGPKYYKISVEGGAVVPLADTPVGVGASWGEDGNIVFGDSSGLKRIPSGGGRPLKVTELAGGEIAHGYPQVLPGGKAVLFAAYPTPTPDAANIEVVTLADGHRKMLVRGGTSPHYLPISNRSGYLLYTNNATLFAIPFDLDKLETRGTAVPILDDVAYLPPAQFDVSRSGTLVYHRGGVAAPRMTTIQWITPGNDGAGKKEPLLGKPGVYSGVDLSPDGKKLAMLVTEGGRGDVWVYDQQRDAMTRLTFGGGPYTNAIWTPDSQYIIIGSFGSGMFWTRADGAGQPQPLTQTKAPQAPRSFTPDGKRLAYYEQLEHAQLWTIPVEETNSQLKAGKPEQFLQSQFTDVEPVFSPDGKWLAYTSITTPLTMPGVSGEAWVREFPDTGGRWQISNNGGGGAVWSRTTHDLLYQSGDQIMAVSYTVKGDTFVANKPRVWLAKLEGMDWDLAPDGKRVAVVTPVDTPEAPKQDHDVVFLFNFLDYLRQRVPLGKP